VTARAGWRLSDALRTVSAVTALTIRDALSVRGFRFGSVAARAADFRGRSAVGLVAAEALLVSRRGALMLGRMTTLASGRDGPPVWLVTVLALGMSGFGFALLARVARIAADAERLGPVRQTGVAALAVLVTGHGMDEPDLPGMAIVASGFLGKRAHEIVRLVATLAVRAAVKVPVGSRNLVAAAAALRAGIEPRARRVGIVASNAGTRDAATRVVGMLVAVTLCAGSLGRAAHVVRRVAALALGVLAHPLSTEHVHVFVAAPAGDGLRFLELMRPVAADALAVALGKYGGLRHDRTLRGVTGGATAPRLGCRRVLVLMAEATGSARRFSVGSVGGRDVAVTGGARRGLGLGILVRAVATHALVGAVNLHRGNRALALSVAALAIACGVTERSAQPGLVTGALERERVARGAVGASRGAEALLSFFRGVLDAGLLFMASRAALGFDASDRVAGELVALGARNLLVHDVDLMAAGFSGALPLRGHVDTEPVGTAPCAVTVGISARHCDGHEQRRKEPYGRQPVGRTRHLGCHHSLTGAHPRQQRTTESNPWRSRTQLSGAGRSGMSRPPE